MTKDTPTPRTRGGPIDPCAVWFDRATKAEADLTACRAALQAIVVKLDAIAADPSYKAQCSIAWAHGHRYEGPQWVAELAAARAILQSTGEGEGK